MNPLDLLSIGGKILDKVLPDQGARDAAKLALFNAQQAGELKVLEAEAQVALGQIEVNKAEAASDSIFKGGWRPACGWVGAFGLAYQFLLQPLLAWVSPSLGWAVPPQIELGDLMTLLAGMLGLSGFRTYERVKGGIPKGK